MKGERHKQQTKKIIIFSHFLTTTTPLCCVDITEHIINGKDEQIAAGTSNFKGQRMGDLPKQSLGTKMGHYVYDDPHLLWSCNPLHDRR